MSHHIHTPEQRKRIDAFLKKAGKEKRLPESYYAHLECEVELTAYQAFGTLQAEFASINPIVQLKYFLTQKGPHLEPTKDMRKCASGALLSAAIFGDVKYAEGLIRDLKADVNYISGDGSTPLYHAVRRKRLGMAEMLLKQGAKNIGAKNTLDPLSYACATGFHQAIPLFIKYGVDVNQSRKVKDWKRFYLGYSNFYVYPLAVAVIQNQAQATQTLLNNGAKLDLKIRPNLTIRELMENTFDDMPDDMQTIVRDALSKPQKVTIRSQQSLPVYGAEKVRA